jgi:anti-sigma factor RsiW
MSRRECDRLDDYLLGGLSGGETTAFETHLAGCPACRDELQWQWEIDRLLAQGTRQFEPVPVSLVDRIQQQYGRYRRRRVVRLAWCGSAAALATAVLIVWLAAGRFGAGDPPQPMVQQHPESSGDQEPVQPPTPESARTLSVARVRLSDPSDAILVPLRTQEPNVSIVWVYPTVKPAHVVNVPGND